MTVIGSPIIEEKVDLNSVANFILENKLSEKLISEINGQFLLIIYNINNNSLIVINDRFNSIHFYWACRWTVYWLLYLIFFKILKKNDKFKLNQNSILQFLWMSRIMGDATHDNFSKYLLPASILEINNDNYSIKNYWRPNFNKIKRSKKEAGSKYIHLLINSIRKLTSEDKKIDTGIFSSGLDSRTVSTAVSLVNKKLKSFTVAFSENLEVKFARKVLH